MSHFSDGVSAYKSGDYHRAINEFHAAVEENDQDHKAWNALGTALSKSGDYEGAATCFENALILAPNNTTYLKNQDRNNAKRGSTEDEIELDDEPPIKRRSIKVEEPLGLGVTICVVIGFLFGIVSAIIALFFGGLASAFGASGGDFILGRAWIGIFLTFVGLPCPFVKHKNYSMLILGLTGLMILLVMGLFGLLTGILYLLAAFLIYRNIGLELPYFIDFSNDKLKKGLYSLIIIMILIVSVSGLSMDSNKGKTDKTKEYDSYSSSGSKLSPTSLDKVSSDQDLTKGDCEYFKYLLKGKVYNDKLIEYLSRMRAEYSVNPQNAIAIAKEGKNYFVNIEQKIEILDVSSSNQGSKILFLKGLNIIGDVFDAFINSDSSYNFVDKAKESQTNLLAALETGDKSKSGSCIANGIISADDLANAEASINTEAQSSSSSGNVPITPAPFNDEGEVVAVQPRSESLSNSVLTNNEQVNSGNSLNAHSQGYDFSPVTHATLWVSGKNWNSDAQNDGVVIYPDLKDDKDETVKWSGETLPVDAEIWTKKMNDKFKYVQDRLVYSGSGTISSWEDGNMFMKGGIRVAFSQMNVPTGESYGITIVKVHLPNQQIIESKFDSTPLTP